MIGDNWTSLFVFPPNAAPVNKPSPCAFLNNVSLIAYGGLLSEHSLWGIQRSVLLKNCSNRTRTHSNQHDVRSLLDVLVKFYLFFFTAKIKISFPLLLFEDSLQIMLKYLFFGTVLRGDLVRRINFWPHKFILSNKSGDGISSGHAHTPPAPHVVTWQSLHQCLPHSWTSVSRSLNQINFYPSQTSQLVALCDSSSKRLPLF